MKIRALRTLRTDVGTVRRDEIVDLTAPNAKSLIARGLAEALDDDPKTKTKGAKSSPKTGVKTPEGD